MIRLLLFFVMLWFSFFPALSLGDGGNPFFSKEGPDNVSSNSSIIRVSFLEKVARYQHLLKIKMSALIRDIRQGKGIVPFLSLLSIAFIYGVVHAAGPGHGKAVAMSFMMSRKASIGSGVLFGTLVAFFHALSGSICVLSLYFIVNKGIAGTLGTVSYTTQVVSFSMITLLGLGIFLTKCHTLFFKPRIKSSQPKLSDADMDESRMALLPWAFTVGMIPCPGVIMVLLFCLSMGMSGLGLLLAAFICLGMAVTISFVVVLVAAGKKFSIDALSREGDAKRIELIIGMISGLMITALGSLFLATVITHGPA